jgi:nucleotide-binding universal stress UspA family protein
VNAKPATAKSGARPAPRILLALDSPETHAGALACVCQLAATMEAEIAGLFVEDINLLRLAELPFSRQVRHASRAHQPLSAADVERQLRARGNAARKALETAAGRAGVPWTFKVTRGVMANRLIEAANRADLVAFGEMRCSLLARGDLNQLASRTPSRRAPDQSPVVVTYDRSAAAARALDVAQRIARAEGRGLIVLLVAGTKDGAEKLRARAGRQLSGQSARFERLIEPKINDVVDAVRQLRAGTAVLEGGKTVLEQRAIQALIDRLDCPVLIVR